MTRWSPPHPLSHRFRAAYRPRLLRVSTTVISDLRLSPVLTKDPRQPFRKAFQTRLKWIVISAMWHAAQFRGLSDWGQTASLSWYTTNAPPMQLSLHRLRVSFVFQLESHWTSPNVILWSSGWTNGLSLHGNWSADPGPKSASGNETGLAPGHSSI